jgi:hypothetical protein
MSELRWDRRNGLQKRPSTPTSAAAAAAAVLENMIASIVATAVEAAATGCAEGDEVGGTGQDVPSPGVRRSKKQRLKCKALESKRPES